MRPIPVKTTGGTLSADEFNSATVYEQENFITDTGITLSAADNYQMSKSASNYVARGDYYTDAGTANNYILTLIGNMKSPTSYQDGLRVRFRPINTNTTSSTINLNSLGVKSIKKPGGIIDVAAGDIVNNSIIELVYNANIGSGVFELLPSGSSSALRALTTKINGLIISNNIATPNTKIDISIGDFIDDSYARMFSLTTGLTKLCNTSWAVGNNAGALPASLTYSASTCYHVFAIAKSDGTTDMGIDTSIVATNLLATATGYIYYLRIGSVFTDSSSNIRPFTCINYAQAARRDFLFKTWIDDVINTNNTENVAVLYTLTVPTGLSVEALIQVAANPAGTLPADPRAIHVLFTCPLINDLPVSSLPNVFDGYIHIDSTTYQQQALDIQVITNTSAQIRVKTRKTALTTTDVLYISTQGWREII